MFSINVSVQDSEVERVYKHVHHATTLVFLERARLAFMESLGCPSSWFIAQDLYPVVAKIAVAYKRELFKEELRVECSTSRIEGKILVLDQRIINSKGKEAVSAVVDCAFMQGATKRAALPPEAFLQAINKAGQG